MNLRKRLLLGVGLTSAAALAVGTTAVIETRTEGRQAAGHALTLEIVRLGGHLQQISHAYFLTPTPARLDTLGQRFQVLQDVVDSLAAQAAVEPAVQGIVDRVARLGGLLRQVGGLEPPAGTAVGDRDTATTRQRVLVGQILSEIPWVVADAIALNARTHEAMERTDRYLDKAVMLWLAVLMLVVLYGAWWLVHSFVGRLETLHRGAVALAAGDLGHRVPVSGTDELGNLVGAFNRMAGELEGAITYARHKVEERIAAQSVLERQLRQQAAVVELGALALSDVSVEGLERDAVRVVAEGLDVELVGVLECEPDPGRLRMAAGMGWTGLAAAVDAGEESPYGLALTTEAPTVFDDLGTDSRFRTAPLLATEDVRSGICVRIDGQGRPYGVLGAYSRSVRGFSAEDTGFIQSVAHLLAQAVAARAARDALRESEQRYQDFYDQAPSMYWSVELATGRILACNATAARELGYDREALIGRSIFDLYAPESHAAVRAGIRTLQERGEVQDAELIVRRHDGTTLDVSLQATTVRDAQGTVVASRSTWRDITERKRAERALKLSLDRLAQAERVAVMGNWHYDAVTHQVTFSDGHYRLFGIEPQEFDGTRETYLSMVHPGDRAAVDARLRRYLRERRGGHGEYRILRADGEVRHVRGTAEVATDPSGTVTSMFGTTTDVTDRRRLEEQLRHVIEHSTNLFYSHTADHVLTYVSPQVRDVLDCEPDEALVRWTGFLTDHPENNVGLAATERAIATGQRQPPYELQLQTATGRLIWVEVREAPLVRDGCTVAVVGALTDITERRRIEAALRLEREMLDRTVNNVPIMLGVFDSEGRIQFVNRSWERTLGWSLGECRAHPDLMAALYPDEAEREQVLRFVQEASGEWGDFRTRVRDGRVLDTTWANVRLSDGSLIGIGQDITERKAAERALAESEERLRLAVSAANQGLFDADVQTGISVVSPEYCRMLGFEPDELEMTHRVWLDRMHPEDRARVAKQYADYVAGRRPSYEVEFRLRAKDGTWKWILAVGKVVQRDEDGRPLRFLGTHTDITARKVAEAEVHASRERIREMAFAQEQTREAERARMARELHDEMGQALTGFKMDLSWLRARLSADDDAAQARAHEALGLVDTMVDVVRRMSGELRPGVLDDLGLAAAIRWQVREFGRRADVPIDVTGLDDIPDLDAGRALAVFRILQEALTNVARHADATRIEIVAAARDHALRLEVRDDGRGFQMADEGGRAPLGILGMQERAAAWGGTVTVEAGNPKGTVVRLDMPGADA